jgi:hypothetical protein
MLFSADGSIADPYIIGIAGKQPINSNSINPYIPIYIALFLYI